MIVLLGSTGYVGRAFEAALKSRNEKFVSLSRKEVDYTRFDVLRDYLKRAGATFVLNSAGYTGKPNVDACETDWAGTLQGNTLFPQTVAQACSSLGIPYGHVSSGCIYAGAKVVETGQPRVERDLTKIDFKALRKKNALLGFTEDDEPNFTFRKPPCSFYSGTKGGIL